MYCSVSCHLSQMSEELYSPVQISAPLSKGAEWVIRIVRDREISSIIFTLVHLL